MNYRKARLFGSKQRWEQSSFLRPLCPLCQPILISKVSPPIFRTLWNKDNLQWALGGYWRVFAEDQGVIWKGNGLSWLRGEAEPQTETWRARTRAGQSQRWRGSEKEDDTGFGTVWGGKKKLFKGSSEPGNLWIDVRQGTQGGRKVTSFAVVLSWQ